MANGSTAASMVVVALLAVTASDARAEEERLETKEPVCVERPNGQEVCTAPKPSGSELALRRQCTSEESEARLLEGFREQVLSEISKQETANKFDQAMVSAYEGDLEELERLEEDKECEGS